MAFGNPTRYIQLDPAKVRNIPAGMTSVEAWDAAVDEANRTYCKRMHNLFCDNCHSHVCRALQTMEYSVGVPRYLPTIVHPHCSVCDRVAWTASPLSCSPILWRTALICYINWCISARQGLTHYNMVMLAAGCFFVGKPVSFGRLLYTFAPFVIIVSFWWLARH